MESIITKHVGARRSTVLSLSLRLVFPVLRACLVTPFSPSLPLSHTPFLKIIFLNCQERFQFIYLVKTHFMHLIKPIGCCQLKVML
jgi:hypothetical protein